MAVAGAGRARPGNYKEAQTSAEGRREMMEPDKFLEEVSLQQNRLSIIHCCISQMFIETLPHSGPWAGRCVCYWSGALAWGIHIGVSLKHR